MIYYVNTKKKAGSGDKLPERLQEAARMQDIDHSFIDSKDCIISIGQGTLPNIVHSSKIISNDNARFFIRSYVGDIYFTYLLAKIASHNGRLVTDIANLLHAASADKMTMMVTLAQCPLPVPSTLLCTAHSYELNKDYIDTWIKYPCVVKKTGSKGQKVWKVHTTIELEEKLYSDTELTMFQEYIQNDHDLRVIIYNGQCIGAVRRNTADGFYNNVSQGGVAEKTDLTEFEVTNCIEAAAAAGLRLAGVDFVRTENGMLFFETNKNPQLYLFSEALGFDLEAEIASRILKDLME